MFYYYLKHNWKTTSFYYLWVSVKSQHSLVAISFFIPGKILNWEKHIFTLKYFDTEDFKMTGRRDSTIDFLLGLAASAVSPNFKTCIACIHGSSDLCSSCLPMKPPCMILTTWICWFTSTTCSTYISLEMELAGPLHRPLPAAGRWRKGAATAWTTTPSDPPRNESLKIYDNVGIGRWNRIIKPSGNGW